MAKNKLTEKFEKDPAYRKLKTLRQSGYKGPVDEHGNKVTSGKAKEILDELRKK